MSREDLREETTTARASFLNVLEIVLERFGRFWMCIVFLLCLGMLCVVIWSQWVYDSCNKDQCNQPLKPMLRVLYLIIAIHAFHREFVRHLLCYDMMRDGPEEPCRVLVFRRASLAVTGLWPVAGSWMLFNMGPQCCPGLKLAMQVIVIYFGVIVAVALLAPAIVVVVVLFLVRAGFIQPPRSVHAAPPDLIERLPKVDFDPDLFDDSGNEGTYPASCSICLDSFHGGEGITRVPCGARCHHAFHTDCLRGWLHCASTCPLCRKNISNAADLPDAGESDTEADIELGQ